MNSLSTEVKNDIKALVSDLTILTPIDVNGQCECECNYPDDCECLVMTLTIATNDKGDTFAVQTGDNSYTGACYGLPHWAVGYIGHECDRADIAAGIIKELDNILADL